MSSRGVHTAHENCLSGKATIFDLLPISCVYEDIEHGYIFPSRSVHTYLEVSNEQNIAKACFGNLILVRLQEASVQKIVRDWGKRLIDELVFGIVSAPNCESCQPVSRIETIVTTHLSLEVDRL
jgi:hypothetical protein